MQLRIGLSLLLPLFLLFLLWKPSVHNVEILETLSLKHTSATESCRIADHLEDPLTRIYGATNLMLSKSYEGSGIRIRRVLQKAKRGKSIKIAVIGGSASAGHAIALPLTSENFMYKRIFQWFQDTFQDAQHELNLDAALPATTNIYFSYCMNEHVPQDADLVLIELDINSNPANEESLAATEAVLRSALSLPSNPAVIYVSIFALSFDNMVHGWLSSLPAAVYLDVPHINIRNFMLPHLMQNPKQIPQFFLNWASDLDLRHMNKNAHVAMGDMVIAYLREQLCHLEKFGLMDNQPHNAEWPAANVSLSVPRLTVLDPWSEDAVRLPYRPRCRAINSQQDPLVPIRSHGWTNITWNDKMSWEATEEGSEITFDFQISDGVAGIWYWATLDPAFGAVECHIDDDLSPSRLRWAEASIPGNKASSFEWSRNMWTDIPSGKHEMTCKLIRGKFRISTTVTR